jgi:glutathione S-transferase
LITVYGMADSGNCYKVKLCLDQLKLPYRWVVINTTRGETRTKEFLARNANAQVPTLELEDGGYLPESGAILAYLAEGTPLLPSGRLERARVLQWMFFEQYSHEPCIAVARAILRYQPPDSPRRAELPTLRERGAKALGVMQQQLAASDYIAGSTYTIADIALYAYTHCAADGGFELARYPALLAWLMRVKSQPGHVPLG